jgi:hypothetical protein
MSKSPFEIRLELISVAQRSLEGNYHELNNRFLRQNGCFMTDTDRIYDYGLKEAPVYPTIAQIVEQADELNRFVSGHGKKSDDATVIDRIKKAPERRVYHVDVGNLPPDKAEEYLEKIKKQVRGSDDDLTIDDDYFFQKTDKPVKVETKEDKMSEEAKKMKNILVAVNHAGDRAEVSEKVMEEANKALAPHTNPELIMEFDLATRRVYPETAEETTKIDQQLKDHDWPDNERTRAHILKTLREYGKNLKM